MNTQRVTISLPKYIYNELSFLLGKGKISSFIAEATESKLLEKKLRTKDAVEAFFSHREGLPKLTDKKVMAAIKKGRT